jgi:N-acetylglucosamine kinase-like BadF-type ATPase
MNPLMDVLLLGIDRGGSGCRARLCTLSGETLQLARNAAESMLHQNRAGRQPR